MKNKHAPGPWNTGTVEGNETRYTQPSAATGLLEACRELVFWASAYGSEKDGPNAVRAMNRAIQRGKSEIAKAIERARIEAQKGRER